MQTIGEKLEEARKQKGITIREAAEITKVRGEFLAHFENNYFEINLPEIYILGFLKLYAKFLGLDAQQIGIEYQAQRMGGLHFNSTSRDAASRPARETFGHVEVDSPAADTPAQESKSTPQRHIPFSGNSSSKSESTDSLPAEIVDKGLYWKTAAVIAASVIALVFIGLLISMIMGSGKSEESSQTTTVEEVIRYPQILRVLFAPGSGTPQYTSYMVLSLDENGEARTSSTQKVTAQASQTLEINGPVRIAYINNGGRLSLVLPSGETIDSTGNRGTIHYDGRKATIEER